MKPAAMALLDKIRKQKTQPNAERLRSALSRSKIPDRVPFMELFADGEVMAAILGKPMDYFYKELQSEKEWEERNLSLIEFYEMLGYDYVRVDTRDYETIVKENRYAKEQLAPGEIGSRAYMYRAADISPELNRGERAWANEHIGVIANWDDFRKFKWEDPDEIAEESIEGLEWACDHVPPGMGIVTGAGSVLEPVMWLMGIKNFYISLYKQPDLVDAMFKKVGELSIARFKLAAKTGKNILALWGSDDWGYRDGLMISPAMMRRWVFPIHKQQAEIAHSRGSLYLLHSCGNLKAIMDDIIDYIKVDAKHSFEDTYLPVVEAKRLYGKRIGIIGGVDMDFLSRRSMNEVRAYVSNILKICKQGGGYCLGSGNTIANYVPLENYLTMLDVGLEEGWYD
ncbi:MAG: uroporphyrinogen decarboxylase family protein [Thermoproteota archaeon]